MIQYIFLGLFVLASVVHLFHSWSDDPKRRYSKPFLLACLALYYCFAAHEINWILVAALVTSWLGDVLLIPKGTKWFVAGGISFLICHIFFVFVYLPQVVWQNAIWWIVIPAAIVYYGISLRVTLSVKKNVPIMVLIPMILYLIMNSTMNLFALMQLMSLRSAGSIVAYIGAVLFFISDCTLYLVRYHDNKNLIFKKHFTVMLTYLAGEALITIGMLMVQNA
ncbi:MAG: lysoplasmalogenase [Clostridia bacterium]|nr:lysoplasmalogenase [Clostridia bacterium]